MELTGQVIAVTGASGFLGSHVALDLLSAGARVRCVVRSPEKAAWLAERGCTVARADLADVDALTEAFRGADAIVANAALYTLGRASWEDFHAANEVGTRHTLVAAARAGVRRVVYVSTCGVYRPGVGKIDEDAPRLRASDRWWFPWAYPVSKAVAEDVAWALAAEHDLQITVVRPAGIYGPRDTQAVPLIRRLLGWPALPAPTFRFPMSHGADVARGIRGALRNDASVGRAYNLSGEPLPVSQLLRAWKRGLGRGPVLVPLWVPLGMDFDNSRAKAELGFVNRPVDDAVRDTLAAEAP